MSAAPRVYRDGIVRPAPLDGYREVAGFASRLAYNAACVRIVALDGRLRDADRRVFLVVLPRLELDAWRCIPHGPLAAALHVHRNTVVRALEALVRLEYLAEGELVHAHRTYRVALRPRVA